MAADPVGNRRNDIGGDDEERIIHLPQSAGENNEEESNGEDEGEGDDGLEAGGRHLGRWVFVELKRTSYAAMSAT